MSEIVLTTCDWVPDMPRGLVRDLRVRWALEEAALPYRVKSTSFRERGAAHFAAQPFGQVPWLEDGDIAIFESGAILLHLAGLPRLRRARNGATGLCQGFRRPDGPLRGVRLSTAAALQFRSSSARSNRVGRAPQSLRHAQPTVVSDEIVGAIGRDRSAGANRCTMWSRSWWGYPLRIRLNAASAFSKASTRSTRICACGALGRPCVRTHVDTALRRPTLASS